ncbi:MAG TPA: RNA polymerase sigma factor [Xanthomonadaceae bacterium]|nr:RNA polymerase sigma factor [Xanthomonadaceae bacterium]
MNAQALEELIRAELPRAQRGDAHAFGRIVAGCQGGISAIALAMVRDVHTSEDIAQEAFLSAWTKLDGLRNPSSFLPWLRQITRNLARDHLRGRRPDRYEGEFDTILATVADPTPDHPEQLAREQQEEIVADLIDELPQETREILLIYYREGQSSRQVASLLGMRDAAVRKRLSRARQALREDLLSRLGKAVIATAPTAAFTAFVVAGLALSTPAAAAGLAGGAAAAGQGLGKLMLGQTGALSKVLPKTLASLGFAGKNMPRLMVGAAGGILFALIVGIASLVFGLRRYWITAIDVQEKRELLRLGIVGGLIVVGFTGLMTAAVLIESWWLPTTAFVGLIVALGLLNIYWLPRVLARRHALEARGNRLAAARARAIERRNAWIGMALGVVLGSTGLIIGLASSGLV